jgi:hypothetical protein
MTMTEPVKRTNILNIRMDPVMFLQLQTLAEYDGIALSEKCRRILAREISADNAQRGIAVVTEALDAAMIPWVHRIETEAFQARFEMLRMTEKLLPWLAERVLTSMYPKATPKQIYEDIAEQSRVSRVMARKATKKSAPEYLRDLLDEMADAGGLSRPTDEL